jgi:iron complex outermembrane receptor protein
MFSSYSSKFDLRTRSRTILLASAAIAFQFPVIAHAQVASQTQPAGNGVVRGRVLSEATGTYVSNAQISVDGTGITAISGDGGEFTLTGVPAGAAELTIRYAGLEDTHVSVAVDGGQAAHVDVSMKAQAIADRGRGDSEAIVVNGARSGEAAALMQRRAAMNAVESIDADAFGALTMNDVGEFMKNMPGISLDYVEVDTDAVRIGGLDSKYSTFTQDGARLASASPSSRQSSFTQMSITGITRIDLNNTLTARMDADAPGGNVNLVSKYAFLLKKRLLQVQLTGVGTSDSTLGTYYAPDDRKHATIFPGGQISYADVFLGGRLGIALSGSYNANYVQQDRVQTDWAYYSGTNKDSKGNALAGQVLPYQTMWRAGPKFTHRAAFNGALDYKFSDKLAFSLRGGYSFYDVEYYNGYTYLKYGSTTTSYVDTANSTATHLVVPQNANAGVDTEYSHRYNPQHVATANPKLEYKGDTFEVALRGSYSYAATNFESDGFFQRNDTQDKNLGFTLDREDTETPAYNLTQTAGKSWSDPANWTAVNSATSIRYPVSNTNSAQYGGNLDLKKKLDVGAVHLELLGGVGIRTNRWQTNEGGYTSYNYVGAALGGPATLPATNNYQFLIQGFDAGNFNSQGWRADNNYAAYDLFVAHPEYFKEDVTGGLTRKYTSNHEVRETIKAAYGELQGGWGRLRFDIGLRFEHTQEGAAVVQSRAFNAAACGCASGTVDAINYQYYNGQQLWNSFGYDNWFISGGLKYDINRNTVAHFAASQAILRPDYGNLGGALTVNDTALTVSAPNRNLKPEEVTKYFFSLQHYLPHAGILAVSAYRLDVKNMQYSAKVTDPALVGLGDEYNGYQITTTLNQPGVSSTNGVIFEYSQQLTFLPGALKGLGVRGSFTYVDPDGPRVSTPDYSANWAVRYNRGPFDVQMTGSYIGTYRTSALTNTPTTAANGILYHNERTLWNLSASYRLDKTWSLQVAGRNIFNAPDIVYSNVRSRVQLYSIYGSMWSAAVKASF